MGKLNIKLMIENQEAYSSKIFEIGALAQQLEIEYGISKMKEIEFSGEDYLIEINVDKNKKNINWNNLNYPNEEVKSKVLEISYYGEQNIILKDILEEINHINDFERGFELSRLGNNALNIIKNIKESECLEMFNKTKIINDINHTLNKEVKSLLYRRKKLSERTKMELLSSAKRHLISDIKEYSFWYDYLKINS